MSNRQTSAWDGDAALMPETSVRPDVPAGQRFLSQLRQRWVSVAGGVLAGLLVVLAGAFVATSQATTYTATSQLLLAPKTQADGSVTSALYDTLSNGQLPANAAAIVQEERFLRSALTAQDATGTAGVSVNVTVVPDTSIVEVQVVAPRSGLAVALADEIPQQAIPKVNRALPPYKLTTLGRAAGSQTAASLSTSQWAVLIGVAALVVGGIVARMLRPRARRPDDSEI